MAAGPNYVVIEGDWLNLAHIIADLTTRFVNENTSFTDFLLKDGSRDLTGDWTISTNSITLTAGTLTAEQITSTDDITAVGTITGSTLVSTVAIGTPPLTVTSTTLVDNLNADLLDGEEGAFYAVASTGVTAAAALTDEKLVRGDVDSLAVQTSGIGIDDSDNVTSMGTLGCGAITSTGAIADGAASTFTTGTTIGNLTFADGSITDSGGTINFGDENLTTTGLTTTAELSITDPGQEYKFMKGTDITGDAFFDDTLGLQGMSADTASRFLIANQTLDGGDDLSWDFLWLLSGVAGANQEKAVMGWDADGEGGSGHFRIGTFKTGTGTVRPIDIHTSGNVGQLHLNADGTTTFNIADDNVQAFKISESGFLYFTIDTRNGTEEVSFGDPGVNQDFFFLGSGNFQTANGAFDIDGSGNIVDMGTFLALTPSIVFGSFAGDSNFTIRNSAAGQSTGTASLLFSHNTVPGGKIVSGREGTYIPPSTSQLSNLQFYTCFQGTDILAMKIDSNQNTFIGDGGTTDYTQISATGSISQFGTANLNGTTLQGTATGNVALSEDGTALASLDANPTHNIAIGNNAGNALTDGDQNIFIGLSSGESVTTGVNNMLLGTQVGPDITGSGNTGVGRRTLYTAVSGDNNTAIGTSALNGNGASVFSQQFNTAIGYRAGYKMDQGSSNVFIGREAGWNQTNSVGLLIIDNQQQATAAAEITDALIYGIFAATPAGQSLRINGQVSAMEKSGMSVIGGFMVKLTNKTGGNTVAGQLVRASAGTADAFSTVATNSQETIGIVLDAGIADGSEAWVVVSGIADVLMDGGGSGIGDRLISSTTAGSADVWNVGGAVATHFQEIGHCLETRVGAGLARAVLHFN